MQEWRISLLSWVHVVPRVGVITTTPSNFFFLLIKVILFPEPSMPRAFSPTPARAVNKILYGCKYWCIGKAQGSKTGTTRCTAGGWQCEAMIKGVWSPTELSLCDGTFFVVHRMQCVAVCKTVHFWGSVFVVYKLEKKTGLPDSH